MLLLIAEFVVGFGFLALATVATGWAYFLIVAAVWAIAMVLLIPLVASVVGFTWFVSTTSW